jgi:hypothetical protein
MQEKFEKYLIADYLFYLHLICGDKVCDKCCKRIYLQSTVDKVHGNNITIKECLDVILQIMKFLLETPVCTQ